MLHHRIKTEELKARQKRQANPKHPKQFSTRNRVRMLKANQDQQFQFQSQSQSQSQSQTSQDESQKTKAKSRVSMRVMIESRWVRQDRYHEEKVNQRKQTARGQLCLPLWFRFALFRLFHPSLPCRPPLP